MNTELSFRGENSVRKTNAGMSKLSAVSLEIDCLDYVFYR